MAADSMDSSLPLLEIAGITLPVSLDPQPGIVAATAAARVVLQKARLRMMLPLLFFALPEVRAVAGQVFVFLSCIRSIE